MIGARALREKTFLHCSLEKLGRVIEKIQIVSYTFHLVRDLGNSGIFIPMYGQSLYFFAVHKSNVSLTNWPLNSCNLDVLAFKTRKSQKEP